MSEAQGRRRASRHVLLASLWLTLLVLAIKFWVGWATQSLSLVSESLHTLVTSFSLLLSLMAASSPYTSGRELWGHSKLEATMTLLLIAFMGFACFSLISISIQQLEAIGLESASTLPVQINLPLIQLIAVVTATIFCLAFFQRYQARLLESASLRFGANWLLQDGALMVLVLAGLVGVWRGQTWLDPLVAILMVCITVAICWRVLNWQLPSLMQQIAIAPEALAQTVHQVEGITHCYGIQTRGMVGRYLFVEMRLVLHPECLGVARTIAERVERAIRERYGPARVVIHIDNGSSNAQHYRY